MSKHTTYRGVAIDMETMSRENEHVTAIGNNPVNAKGDRLGRGGMITKTAAEIARENHRVQTTVIHSGLKGPMPESPVTELKTPAPAPVATPVKATAGKAKEKELPNGDITIEDSKE